MPIDVKVQQMRATFVLRGGKALRRSAESTLVSERSTRVSVSASKNALDVTFGPPLRFVLHPQGIGPLGHLVEDVHWHGVRYAFRHPGRPATRVDARLARVPAWFAFDFASREVEAKLEATIAELLADLAFARPNYDPTTDPALADNFRALAAKFSRGEQRLPPAELAGFGGRVQLRVGFRRVDRDTRVELQSGTRITVDVDTRDGGSDSMVVVEAATLDFEPPLFATSAKDTFKISSARLWVTKDGPVVEILEARPQTIPGIYAFAQVAGAAVGALRGRPQAGANVGVNLAHGFVTGGIGLLATRAVVEALERLRPQLKERAPLIDWDALLRNRGGRPAMPRPVSAG